MHSISENPIQGGNIHSNGRRPKRLVLTLVAAAFVFMSAAVRSPRNPDEVFTVVLDAGHGGKDPGNLGSGRFKTTEKDIALDVTKRLGQYIKENYPEVEVVYTRTGDSYPELKTRTDIANNAQADLFISIHLNANENRAAFGSETFVMGLYKSDESLRTAMKENSVIYNEANHESNYSGFDPNNPDTYIILSMRENIFLDQSLELAKSVQDQFRTRVGRKDRGVKQAGFYVISFTNMPSVLVELGFLTNNEEEDFLNTEEGKTYLASAIFRAFKDFKEKHDQKNKGEGPKTETVAVPDPPVVQSTDVVKPEVKAPVQSEEGIIWRDVPTGVKYQVQVVTSAKPVDKKSPDFRGLGRVDEYLSNGVYKYLAGCTGSYKEAKQIQQMLRDRGFKDAFIVAFENGKRIDLSEAIGKTQ